MAFISPFKGVRFNNVKINEIKQVMGSNSDLFTVNFPNIPEFFDVAFHHSGKKDTRVPLHDISELFNSWIQNEYLIQDTVHGLYLHETLSKHTSEKTVSKLSLICLMRIEEVEQNIIKPHKETSQQITNDTAVLLQNSKAQFTPVAALFSDRTNIVFDLLLTEQKTEIFSIEDDEGYKHRLFKIEQPDTINSIQHFFDNKDVYISEGHETYNAAINNKLFLQETDSTFSSKHPANHVMFCLSKLEDKDLKILPTHSLVLFPTIITSKHLTEILHESFKVSCFNQGSRENIIVQLLNRMDELDKTDIKKEKNYIGIYHPKEDCGFLIEKIDCSSESNLDIDILTHELLPALSRDELVTAELENRIQYFVDPDEALDICVKTSISSNDKTPLLFLLNPTRVEQILHYADNKQLMPYHATYFSPKTNVCPIIHNYENGIIIDDIFMEPVRK